MTNPPSKFDRWVYRQADRFLTPVLKVVNRALLALNKWLLARSTKCGTPMSIQFDDVGVTGEETDFQLSLRDVIEGYPERGNDVG